MSPAQEVRIGASEHEKIIKTFGLASQDLQNYVNEIGQKIVVHTERPGAISLFCSRYSDDECFCAAGRLYLCYARHFGAANDEAALAAVVAHEIAHVTAAMRQSVIRKMFSHRWERLY